MRVVRTGIALGVAVAAISSTSLAQEYFGKFVDLPVSFESNPNGSAKPFKVTRSLRFVDPNGLEWVVPAGSHTDGATIPWLFEIIVGDNYDGPYFPAAVVHDYYCCIQTRMAHDTHRNFYYAMQANETPGWQAWLMYTAVRIGGPDWTLTQASQNNDGSLCFDEVQGLSMSRSSSIAPVGDGGAGSIVLSQSPQFDAFVQAAATAQNQRNTFLVSKLMAVAKTLRDSEGKVIDVTAFGQIPATFEGVEQLKAIVDGATSFAGFSTIETRTGYADFGLLVPLDGDLPTAAAELKEKGGLVAGELGWTADEFNRIGIAAATLPQTLPETYLLEAARTTQLQGTGVEWATARSPQELHQWGQVIDADRSYRTWLNTRDVFAPK